VTGGHEMSTTDCCPALSSIGAAARAGGLARRLRREGVRTTVMHEANKSVSGYLRTLTTRHCPHSPAAAAAAIDRDLPTGLTAANLQQRYRGNSAAAGLLPWAHAGTDGRRTTYRHHRPCCVYYAGSVNNVQ